MVTTATVFKRVGLSRKGGFRKGGGWFGNTALRIDIRTTLDLKIARGGHSRYPRQSGRKRALLSLRMWFSMLIVAMNHPQPPGSSSQRN